jgi:hypothetical protein
MASISGTYVGINCLLDSPVEKGRFVRSVGLLEGTPTVAQASIGLSSSGHNILGVASSAGSSGERVDVQISGVCCFLEAGAEMAAGALVTTDSVGRAVQASSGDRAVGRLVCGREGASYSTLGEECTVLLNVICDVV